MRRIWVNLTTSLLLAAPVALSAAEGNPGSPNILLILADDLGYGDVSCYNDRAKVPTPNLDRLAREGMRFTDAHSPATVCTPARYSLMTGQMAFRVPNGGNRYENNPDLKPFMLPDTAPGAPGQLYNLEADPGETRNLYFECPEIVKELKGLLETSKVAGRTAPRSQQ